MKQQFSEEEQELRDEKEEYQVQTLIFQFLRKLLHQQPRLWVLFVVSGGTLLAALAQNGLLGPLVLIAVITIVVFLALRHRIIDTVSRPVNVSVVREHVQRWDFAWVKTLDDLCHLTPYEFEKLVGDVMKYLHYTEVEVVGRSRDLCVDIKAIEPNGEKVAVQCKRYTSRNVNSDEMQKFIGMIYLHHRVEKGMYFTTSSYTKEACKLGKDNRIELIDGIGLVKIIHDLSVDQV